MIRYVDITRHFPEFKMPDVFKAGIIYRALFLSNNYATPAKVTDNLLQR